MSEPATPSATPRVTVLMATYNGRQWLDEQLDSILDQRGVTVRIVARDDHSSDGTAEALRARAQADERITVLPDTGASGGAAANFYRLLIEADLRDDLVAFADQDDRWMPDKLARHARLLTEHRVEGVSSSIVAFASDGSRQLVRKDYPQRALDYVLESPGPGSTFLMTPRLARAAADLVRENPEALARTEFHDWVIYALARSRGWGWFIDSAATVEYRQHDANVMGANVGARSAVARLRLMAQHWHRRQAVAVIDAVIDRAEPESRAVLGTLRTLLDDERARTRLAIARRARQLRRRPRDAALIAGLTVMGLW
jgi:rhamnosyltransferase